MKIYLASSWARREEARAVRDVLVANGYEITSRWLDVDETTCTPVDEAANDVYDVLRSTLMVVLNLQKSEGKAFEQGLAFAAGIPCIVVAEEGAKVLHIFQLLPGYTFVPNIAALLQELSTRS